MDLDDFICVEFIVEEVYEEEKDLRREAFESMIPGFLN